MNGYFSFFNGAESGNKQTRLLRIGIIFCIAGNIRIAGCDPDIDGKSQAMFFKL
jgi:hypothetical protein